MLDENFESQTPHGKPELPQPTGKSFKDQLVDMLNGIDRQLLEAGKKLTEIVPKERNFNIITEKLPSGVHIKLKHKKTGEEKDLNSFLPPKHFFGDGKEFYFSYSKELRKIFFPRDELPFRGFLLALFHEIGHAHEKQEHDVSTWETLRALYEAVPQWVKNIRMIKETQQKGKENETPMHRLVSLPAEVLLPVGAFLPQWYLDKKSRFEAQSERNAWAFALKSLRKLKREGYDVFAGFENAGELREYVAYFLYTYDTGLFMDKLTRGDLRGAERIGEKPFFSRKSAGRNRVWFSKTEDKIVDQKTK